MEKQMYVVIAKYGSKKPVKLMGPMSPRVADKTEDGANINLNHEEYYTYQEVAKKKATKKFP